MTKIAKLVSYLFHPAFMPLLGIFIIFNSGIYASSLPWEAERYTYLIIALFSVLLPFSILPVFYYWRLIASIELKERKQRILPLSVSTLCLILMHLFISRIIPIKLITSYTFAIAALAIFLLFLNMFFKVSMHLLGVGGITGLIAALTVLYQIRPFFMLVSIILISGLLASARIQLKAHTQFEVIAGYVVGFLTMYLFLISMV
ncbi:MAG TPA: hypothetical protein DDX98_16385 [Bacteroidales bacterium]|jgi:hypothetical protein|nr:hypothetical protein [Bacteroidales bacterium]